MADNPWDNDPLADDTNSQPNSSGTTTPWASDPVDPSATSAAQGHTNWLSSMLQGTSKVLGGGNIPRSTDTGAMGVLSNTGRYIANNAAQGFSNMADALNESPEDTLAEAKERQSNPFYTSPRSVQAGLGALQSAGSFASGMGRGVVADPLANAIGVDPAQRNWQPDDSIGTMAKKSLVDFGETAGSAAVPAMVGAALKIGAKAVIPEATDAAKTLTDAGVTLTPGQHYDPASALRSSEDLTERIPIAGSAITRAKENSLDSFADAIYNRSLSAIGEDPLPGGLSGRAKVNYVEGKLNDFYNQLKPLISYTPSQEVAQDAYDIMNNQVGLNPTQRDQYVDIAKHFLSQGTQDGDAFKQLDSMLGQKGMNYWKSTNPDQEQLGDMLLDLKGAIREDMASQNPNIADQLDWANDGYSKFMTAQKAATRRASSLGEFTPEDLASIMRQENQRQFARGSNDMQDLTDAALQQMSGGIGQSSISKGIAANTLINNPKSVLGGVAALPLYSDRGRQIFSDIATRQPVITPSLVMNPKSAKRAVGDIAAQEDRND